MAQAGQGGGNPGPTPDPNTGDILQALQAEQATMADVANFGQQCATTMVSMYRDQRALLSEIQKQTRILENIENILNGFSTNQQQYNTQQNRYYHIDRQNTMTNRMRTNNMLSDVLGLIDKQHRQEAKILHTLENRAKDLNRSTLENLIYKEASDFDSKLSHLFDNQTFYNFGDDFQALMDSLSDTNKQGLQAARDAFKNEIQNIQLHDPALISELRNLNDAGLKKLAEIDKSLVSGNAALQNFDSLDDAEFAKLQAQLQRIQDAFENDVHDVEKQEVYDNSGLEDEVDKLAKGVDFLAHIDEILKNQKMSEGHDISAFVQGSAGPFGDFVSDALKDTSKEVAGNLGEAAGFALGGPAGGAIGKVVGEVVGERVAENIGKAIERATKALGELMETITMSNRKTRDDAIKLSFEKIRQDVKTMSTYQIDIIESATQKIYDAWDNNLTQVNATMGYTKAQLNTLQDSIAQRLQEEGYGSVIDASNYLDELSKTLEANLNGKIAEEFATQALILEKAVPEFDATSMAKEFAAVYTNAVQQGQDGTQAMVKAMEQIAGATKAIEQTTDGNNQFITQIGEYLQKSTEIVRIAGGSVDKVAELTTQMMAAEGPIGSLTPQLSGFTGELVDILTNKNDSTAVALRAIMHDMNSSIGITQTEFRESFINDTKGTLETAFKALEQFIESNSSEGAKFEFLDAMSEIFGVSSEKLAQLDFGYIADQLSNTNEVLNKSALVEAEQLLRDGETTTLEEQLVANTANQLLATNQVRDTLDNKVMRELEKHELELERQVLALTATQSVDLAESTMGFFTKLKDIIVDLLDPLGIFKNVSSVVSAFDSTFVNAANYRDFRNLNSISSDLEDTRAADTRSARLTTEGAESIYKQMMEFTTVAGALTNADKSRALRNVVNEHGISNTDMLQNHQETMQYQHDTGVAAQQAAEASASTLDLSEEALNLQEEEAKKEEEYRQARLKAQEESLKREEENYQMNVDNHGNLERMAGDTGINVQNMTTLSSDIRELQHIAEEQGKLLQENQGTINTSVTDFNTAMSESVANMSTQIQTKQDAIDLSLNNFHTTYSDSMNNLETNMRDKSEEHVSTLVTAIRDSKPDVSSLRDIKEGVERVITLFSTYLEILDSTMMQSTGQGLQMAASDRQQILGRGLLR